MCTWRFRFFLVLVSMNVGITTVIEIYIASTTETDSVNGDITALIEIYLTNTTERNNICDKKTPKTSNPLLQCRNITQVGLIWGYARNEILRWGPKISSSIGILLLEELLQAPVNKTGPFDERAVGALRVAYGSWVYLSYFTWHVCDR